MVTLEPENAMVIFFDGTVRGRKECILESPDECKAYFASKMFRVIPLCSMVLMGK